MTTMLTHHIGVLVKWIGGCVGLRILRHGLGLGLLLSLGLELGIGLVLEIGLGMVKLTNYSLITVLFTGTSTYPHILFYP